MNIIARYNIMQPTADDIEAFIAALPEASRPSALAYWREWQDDIANPDGTLPQEAIDVAYKVLRTTYRPYDYAV